jgi:DNA-binding NarL/FixJ family response regulator
MASGSRWRTLRSRLPAPGGPAAGRPSGWFERLLVPSILVTYAVGEPLISIGRVLAGPHRPGAAVAAVLAAPWSVPLSLCLLLPAAKARRPRHAGWLIAAFAAINLAAFAVIGAWWFTMALLLAVMIVVYLPPRWSVPAVTALAAVPAAMPAAGRDVAHGQYFAQDIVVSALLMGLLIWLARVAATLQAGQQDLADSAVIAERVRIDDERGASIVAALERLIAAGEHAARTAAGEPAAAGRELRELTAASRRALARTRQMVSRYQAITVLTSREADVLREAAAGISTDQIGTPLSLSPATVRSYLSSAISKTSGHNRIDAIRIARENGWL